MNKTAIKNFAVWARVQLIEAAKQRAYEYEITEDGENKAGLDTVEGKLLTQTEKKQRDQLIEQISRKGYAQVMEEAAYTWFNRFIALRFMEVNGYLPTKTRVFTDENGAFKPEIMKQAMSVDIDGLDRAKILDLLDRQDNEELYKYLLITQCNALNSGLPYMFEKIANWTELLFPSNLLRQDSVLGQMISGIPEEDWTDAVQIIGWLYQYYITELNELVYDGTLSKSKIKKELIPAATTIYTPDWPIRFMVENSLGRLWYDGHPGFDKSQWKYYLEEAEQEPDVEEQLKKIRAEYARLRPEDIKVIDPCMGSGHILVYTFDVLMQIYTSAGWSERDAAKSILENNLYGLDIDERAGQLAYFAVMMKARKYSRRILNGEVKPHLYSFRDSNHINADYLQLFGQYAPLARKLYDNFRDAMEYGSIIEIRLTDDELSTLRSELDAITTREYDSLFDSARQLGLMEAFAPLLDLAEVLKQKYDVVVTNPPYLGSSRFSGKLDSMVKKNYEEAKADLSMVMFKRVISGFAKRNGYVSFITTSSWMFLSSFEKIRKYLVARSFISSLVDFGTELFDGKVGHNPIVAWVTCNQSINYRMTAIRLVDYCYSRRDEKLTEFFNKKNYYTVIQNSFSKIPGSPVAYWVSPALVNDFEIGTSFGDIGSPRTGMQTSNNDKYLRLWFEVNSNEFFSNSKKWIKYIKGGPYRRWYGNLDYVVWYNSTPQFILQQLHARVLPESELEEEKCTWTDLTNAKFSARVAPRDSFHDISGHCFYPSTENYYYLLALTNSNVFQQIMDIINSSMHCQVGDVARTPVILKNENTVDIVAKQNVITSKEDWDSFETSWDFKKHPIVINSIDSTAGAEYSQNNAVKIADCFHAWEKECSDRFNQLKANEEELNRIFIDIYSLQDELTPEVEDKDITVRKADLKRDIKSLISYAVGCLFGRYSVDAEGLCFAGGEWDASKYRTIIPVADNIIPICDDDYFDDDIAGRFVDFVRRVYGDETLEENLRFIADALGGKGTPRQVIRNYFLSDFYADHVKIYQKRPIYWLFSSGKKNGLKALIYMHRYQPDLLARMRTDYVHEQQERYRTQLQMLEDAVQTASPAERVKLNKQMDKLKAQALEIRQYEEKIHHLADQMIAIDLDDGVKVNYAKFQDVLEKIK